MNGMLKMLRPRGKAIVALFFAVLLVVGMAVLPDYGVPSDESTEMRTLRYNTREYLRLLVGYQEDIEDYYYEADVLQENFREYMDREYGMAVFYPVAPFLVLEQMSPRLCSLVWHVYIFLLYMLGCFALYSSIRLVFSSRGLGMLGVLLLYLSPRFFAEGHYNSKDTVMMVLTLLMLWQGIHLSRRATLPRALGFALLGALATNQRIIGLFLFGLMALYVLVRHLVHQTFTLRTGLAALVVLVGFLGLYYVLTPNAWGQPWMGLPGVFTSFTDFSDPDRWNGFVFFEGTMYQTHETPLPGHYLLWFMTITTPLFIVALMLVGQVWAVVDGVRTRGKALRQDRLLLMLFCTVMWMAPIAYVAVAKTTVYNGWRHFQFIYAPLLLLAVYGVSAAFRGIRPRWGKALLAGGLTACLAVTGVGIAQNHPYQYAYFNPLAGDVENRYEADYWFLSVKDALEQLVHMEGLNPDLMMEVSGIVENRLPALSYEDREKFDLVTYGYWYLADYLIVNPGCRYMTNSACENFFEYDYLYENYKEIITIKSYGHVIMRVYERTHVMDELPDFAPEGL